MIGDSHYDSTKFTKPRSESVKISKNLDIALYFNVTARMEDDMC